MQAFEETYKREFGFVLEQRSIIVDDLRVRATGKVTLLLDCATTRNNLDCATTRNKSTKIQDEEKSSSSTINIHLCHVKKGVLSSVEDVFMSIFV